MLKSSNSISTLTSELHKSSWTQIELRINFLEQTQSLNRFPEWCFQNDKYLRSYIEQRKGWQQNFSFVYKALRVELLCKHYLALFIFLWCWFPCFRRVCSVFNALSFQCQTLTKISCKLRRLFSGSYERSLQFSTIFSMLAVAVSEITSLIRLLKRKKWAYVSASTVENDFNRIMWPT